MKLDLQSLTVLTVTFREHLQPFTISINTQIPLIYMLYFFIYCLFFPPRICSGMLNVRNVLKHKVKLGLGTGEVFAFQLLYPCINCCYRPFCTLQWNFLSQQISLYNQSVIIPQNCVLILHFMVLSVPSVDVAGGYSPSILDAMRRTLDTSKTLTIQDPQHQTLTFEEVFRLATLGGSEGIRFQLLTKKLFNTCTGQYINLPGCFPPHSSLIG